MRESLIDLDMSLPDIVSHFGRPSTATSDVGSATSEHKASGNPFELERHASMYQPVPVERGREPSIYVSDESSIPPRVQSGLQELAEVSDFSASDIESTSGRRREPHASHDDSDDGYYVVNSAPSNGLREDRRRIPQYDGADDSDYLAMPPSLMPSAQSVPLPRSEPFASDRFPELPSHPSLASLTGSASPTAMTTEIIRVVSAMSAQLEAFKEVYEPAIHRQGSDQRRDRDTGGI
ncbi:serine/threonine protein kinase [Diplocarpon rosae]|nr:serine/threonine protein kinase [Diplocarpon rosae]